ncbi:MAG: ParB/RepB/Spo0J family partition protein [Acidobacteria bacterium]|nr:ParB/RepB/Spo0J family partition protein [Acidobacteriota bacterium]
MKKKALGRGLGALIPEVERAEPTPNEIDIDRISPNPNQPRLLFDEERLEELAASIRENGVLQPVLVRPFGRDYQLIAGERRLSAAQRAGLLKIPAVVREVPDERLLELALVENIQREQLNPIEEAQAYAHLMEETSQTQEQMAQRLGKDRSTIANAVRLLKLPPAVSLLVSEGKLSAGHARALLSAALPALEMERMAGIVIEKGWSVRETERWATKNNRDKAPSLPRVQDPNVAAAEDRLRLALGTRVEIVSKPKDSGEIRIHYYGQEELMRLFALLNLLKEQQNSTEHKHGIQNGKIRR